MTSVRVVLGAVTWLKAAASCLPEAVPPQQFRNITDQGWSGPLGVWQYDWGTSWLGTAVYTILAQEVLGHEVVQTGLGESSLSGMYATAGCQAPNSYVQDPKCGRVWSPTHVAIDAWVATNEPEMNKFLSTNPRIAPELIGEMGYSGFESQFVTDAILQSAVNTEGLALEFYKSYNTSWHQAWKYFDRYWAIKSEELKPCNRTRLSLNGDIQPYLTVTGDLDGVVRRADGSLAARCWNSSWWLAPSCRSAPETCIPTITGGDGWYVDVMMQKATAYNTLLALGVTATYNLYLSLPRRVSLMLYWWGPDAAFIDLAPKAITFPEYSPSAWARGDKRTQASSQRIIKWGYRSLNTAAPFAHALLSSMQFERAEMDAMLLDSKTSGDSYGAVACRWLQSRRSIWQKWIPSATRCFKGFGLVDLQKNFVQQRSGASACEWCTPGRTSQLIEDDQGTTFVCRECPAGTNQPKGAASECNLCLQGSVAAVAGSTVCTLCPVGEHQNGTGQTGCHSCPALMTTERIGATGAEQCICPHGTYRPCRSGEGLGDRPACSCPAAPGPGAKAAANCLPCPDGMTCPLGSDEANLPCADGALDVVGPAPQLLPGFFASRSAPLHVFLCVSAKACPGGGSDTCGETYAGIACGGCIDGFYSRRGSCEPCKSPALARFLFPVLPILLGLVACLLLYYFSHDPLDRWGSPTNCMVSVVYVALVYVQTISTIGSCFLNSPVDFSAIWRVASYTTDLLAVFSADCLDLGDVRLGFYVELLLPVFAALLFMLMYVASKLLRRTLDMDVILHCYGSVFSTFFLGIASRTFSLFQCYPHPNGEWSVRSIPQLLRGSSAWRSLVAASVAAIFVFCIGSVALFSYAVLVAPDRFRDVGFRKRWKFLLAKFRPTTFWWGLVMLAKGIWLSLTTVIFSRGVDQIRWLVAGTLTYFVGCFAFLPWRSMTVAFLDVGLNAVLLFLFTSVARFVSLSDLSLDAEGRVAAVVTLLAVVLSVIALLILIREWFRYNELEFLSHASAMCDVFTRVRDPELLAAVLLRLPTADTVTLTNASRILSSELLRTTGRRLWRLTSSDQSLDDNSQVGANANEAVLGVVARAGEDGRTSSAFPTTTEELGGEDLSWDVPKEAKDTVQSPTRILGAGVDRGIGM